MKASIAAVLSAAFAVLAQEGNDTAPFPDTTYPDAISPNPAAVAGAQSNQTSPPGYPSPWSSGKGDWAAAHEKAVALVSQLTLEEKVNLTTGESAVDDHHPAILTLHRNRLVPRAMRRQHWRPSSSRHSRLLLPGLTYRSALH